jgi:hypothetical protein
MGDGDGVVMNWLEKQCLRDHLMNGACKWATTVALK